jgi:hypothetical protein
MIRSTDFLEWKDPSHWMEAMKGPRWAARVKEENRAFKQELPDSGHALSAIAKKFKQFQEEHDKECTFTIEHGTVKLLITIQSGNTYRMSWAHYKKHEITIGDVDISRDGIVVFTHDISKGGEEYEVVALKQNRPIWRFNGRSHGVASDVAIVGKRVYLLEAHGPLQYKWLVSLDLATGKGKRIHYDERRESMALSLIRGENGCLFLCCEDSGLKNLFHVKASGHLEQLSSKGVSFVPVGYGRGSDEPCYFVKGAIDSSWEPRGHMLKDLKLSTKCLNSQIEYCILTCGLIIYRIQGERFMEACTKRASKHVAKILGEIHFHDWPFWYAQVGYTKPAEFSFIMPGKTPVKAHYTVGDGLILEKPKTVYGAEVISGIAKSRDGEGVRWVATWKKNTNPKALIMIGYGAYGIPTPFETTRWRPYIEEGFAIGFALIRGGGDDTELWAQKGRLHGKLQGIEDYEACIRAVQRITQVRPKATCLFGRSAGGFLVGAAIVRHPLGDLFSTVYTEVPYVDVLQTAANVDLPLTKLEYNEFGDPAHKIADFEFLLHLSPVSGLGPEGAPEIFVLCRVGMNDQQVFAYESVKWMDALRGRGQGAPKLLFVTDGYGHNVHGDKVYTQRAEDFQILCKKLLA